MIILVDLHFLRGHGFTIHRCTIFAGIVKVIYVDNSLSIYISAPGTHSSISNLVLTSIHPTTYTVLIYMIYSTYLTCVGILGTVKRRSG